MTFRVPCPTCRVWIECTDPVGTTIQDHHNKKGERCEASGKEIKDAPVPIDRTKKEARE